MTARASLLASSFVVLIGLAGCGGTDDPLGRRDVSGTVTLDGKPLDRGTIRFDPATNQGAVTASGAAIENGAFATAAGQGLPPGAYKVSISSPEAPPVAGDPMNAPPTNAVERVPARYNTATELTADVTADGPNRFEFKLESGDLKKQ